MRLPRSTTHAAGRRPGPAALGILRCAFGLGMMLDPSRLARMLGTDRRTAADTGWLTRMVGAREIALGVGTLTDLRRGSDPAPWLVAQALADGGDALALLAALRRGRVGTAAGWTVVVFAAGGALGDLLLMRPRTSWPARYR